MTLSTCEVFYALYHCHYVLECWKLACYIFILTPLATWYDHHKYSITIGSYVSFVVLNKLNSIVHNQYFDVNPIKFQSTYHIDGHLAFHFVVKMLVNKTTNHLILLALTSDSIFDHFNHPTFLLLFMNHYIVIMVITVWLCLS